MVPVIKVFEQPGKIVWLVPDGTGDAIKLMEQETDSFVSLNSGLVKWSAWPDADRWFPMSQPEADRARCFAYRLLPLTCSS